MLTAVVVRHRSAGSKRDRRVNRRAGPRGGRRRSGTGDRSARSRRRGRGHSRTRRLCRRGTGDGGSLLLEETFHQAPGRRHSGRGRGSGGRTAAVIDLDAVRVIAVEADVIRKSSPSEWPRKNFPRRPRRKMCPQRKTPAAALEFAPMMMVSEEAEETATGSGGLGAHRGRIARDSDSDDAVRRVCNS